MIYGIDTNILVYSAIESLPEYDGVKRFIADRIVARRARIGLAPQVVNEFLHVTTDPRRFDPPLSMADACRWVDAWSSAAEVVVLDCPAAVLRRTVELIRTHRLGRKRILDTALAATFEAHGIDHVLTRNGADFAAFGLKPINPLADA